MIYQASFQARNVNFGYSDAHKSEKQNPEGDAFVDYNRSMHRNADKKAEFFAKRLVDLQTNDILLPTSKPYVVVDLGCNTGALLEKLHLILKDIKPLDYFFKFIGVDMNESMLKLASKRFSKYNEIDPSNIKLQSFCTEKNERMKSNPFLKKASTAWIHEGNGWEKWTKKHLHTNNLDSIGRFTVLNGDISEMNYGHNSIDAFLMSSILHEIYSYGGENGYSYDEVFKTLRNLYNSLEPGGRVIIRDPAKPDNPDETMTVTPVSSNGENPDTLEKLLNAEPKTLSSKALLDRFLVQFKPATGMYTIDNDKYIMPAWLISEFIRHRILRDYSKERWDGEMKEQYGVFTQSEMYKTSKLLGFNPIEVLSVFSPNATAVGADQELDIRNSKGEKVKQEDRFPTHIHVVLEKPFKESTWKIADLQ